jgi:hypothetical protein
MQTTVRATLEQTDPEPRSSRRAKLLTAWRRHEKSHVIHLTREQAAGYLLAQHGHARAAIMRCPTEPWWNGVFRILVRVLEEESR